jgi:hypothetical protein
MTISPDKIFGLPQPVKLALFASVPVPMLVYYFGGFKGDDFMLYVFIGVTALFALEAAFLPKILEVLRPKQKADLFVDHMVAHDGSGQNMKLPYAALKSVTGDTSKPQEDEVLLSDGPHIDIAFEFDLDKLADFGLHPDDDTLVIRNVKDENYILTRVQDLTRPYIRG